MASTELYSTPLFNDNNLQVYYRYEDNINDSKNSNNGTSGQNLSYNNSYGKFNNGIYFNDNDSWSSNFVCPYVLPTTFSFSSWFTPKGDFQCDIFSSYSTYGVWLRYSPGGYLICYTKNSGGGTDVLIGGLSINTQYHIGISCNESNNTVKIYLNGQFINSGYYNPVSQSNTITIGTSRSGYSYLYLDDTAFFDRVLTDSEFLGLYEGFTSSDSSKFFQLF